MSAERKTLITLDCEEIHLIVAELGHPRHRNHLASLLSDELFTELKAIDAQRFDVSVRRRFTRQFTRRQLEILKRATQFGELAKRCNLRAYLQLHLEKFDQSNRRPS